MDSKKNESFARKKKPKGLSENIDVAKMGGNAAKLARDNIEQNLGESIVTKFNKLDYEYIDERKIDNK